jgi:hypothetical protein
MSRTLEQANLSGIHILTPRGQLGYFDEQKKFLIDIGLSAAFADYNTRFIQTYLQSPNNADLRVALAYQPPTPRRWNSETLLLTRHMVHTLYPAFQTRRDELTEFQKRNREMSIYRGIELLLAYRTDLAPNSSVYCPVLINRHTQLDRYQMDVDVEPGQPAAVPVFEVLNLVGLVPLRKRNTPEIHELHQRIYQRAIDKRRRRPIEMQLIESGRRDSSRPENSFRDLSAPRQSNAISRSETGIRGLAGSDIETVDTNQLREFERFRSVPFDRLDRFGHGLETKTAPPGAVIAERGGSDDWNYYLLQGVVQLEAEDGGKHIIEGGTSEARAALANLKPRRYRVTAVTTVKYLQIDSSAESALLSSNTPLGFELH